MTPLTTPLPAERYCRGCGYDVRAAMDPPRCPECGRGFDPADPRTTRGRPLRRWVRHVRRAAYALGILAIVLAAIWGWFFWGWYDEQQALAALHPWNSAVESLAPRLSAYPGGFVFDRVWYIDCSGHGLTGLDPLARLHELRELFCDDSSIHDLRPLAGLRQLRGVNLCGTGVTDLTPLAGLIRLRSLDLTDTPVRDIAPLASLKKLAGLGLKGTRITDVRPLEHLGPFRALTLPKETITEEQAESLRRALPGSSITRE